MKLYLKGVIVATAVLGWGWSSSIVGKANNYSARRANSVRLVWRHSMGRHAYHTVKGARYSKHLGVKYSTNDDLPDVTWYTDAHEKLYNKAKRTSAIYYHVKSGDGQHGGWIWRGYLTAGQMTESNVQKPGNDSDQSFRTVEQTNWTQQSKDRRITQAEIAAMKLFPKTVFDLRAFTATNDYLFIDDVNAVDAYDERTSAGREMYRKLLAYRGAPSNKFAFTKFVVKDLSSVESIDQALTKVGFDKEQRSKYAGWHIGISILDYSEDNVEEGAVPGEGLLLLGKD
ncbi:hypothetical protein [Levilactobacillus cerevisiae]|uniref:hypothetical protein n=1 Tax=Levilactobacillus cerevisiae TaxID=1704076 RepID=UPI001CDCF4CF|nr:hypothetical protein [Levilactobacillus cerevisiae]